MKRCYSNVSVADLIDRSRTELIKQNQEKLKNVYSTVLLCARQLITLGHLEENRNYLFKAESTYQIQSKIQSLDFAITTFRLSNHVNFLGTKRWAPLTHSLVN
jgi:heterodisulfide reductase subunit C